MSRTVEDIFANTFPVGPQPLPQGGLYIQAPFHPTEYVSPYLTAEEVGQILHMKVDAVRKLIHDGKIRSSFVGRRYLCTKVDVDSYIRSVAEGGPKGK